jgi:hypothetical protein
LTLSVAHDPLLTLAAAGEPYVQVTTTGRWAEAARLVGSDNALDYLAAFDEPPPAVGIELLWPSAPISFAGTRLDGEEVARLPELVDVLTTAVTDVESVMAALTPQGLGPVVVAQLGAINAWDVWPSVDIWDGSAWSDPRTVLVGYPQLRVCEHPVALEIGHLHAWYAMEVSRPSGHSHRVDEALLAELTDELRDGIGRYGSLNT